MLVVPRESACAGSLFDWRYHMVCDCRHCVGHEIARIEARKGALLGAFGCLMAAATLLMIGGIL